MDRFGYEPACSVLPCSYSFSELMTEKFQEVIWNFITKLWAIWWAKSYNILEAFELWIGIIVAIRIWIYLIYFLKLSVVNICKLLKTKIVRWNEFKIIFFDFFFTFFNSYIGLWLHNAYIFFFETLLNPYNFFFWGNCFQYSLLNVINHLPHVLMKHGRSVKKSLSFGKFKVLYVNGFTHTINPRCMSCKI